MNHELKILMFILTSIMRKSLLHISLFNMEKCLDFISILVKEDARCHIKYIFFMATMIRTLSMHSLCSEFQDLKALVSLVVVVLKEALIFQFRLLSFSNHILKTWQCYRKHSNFRQGMLFTCEDSDIQLFFKVSKLKYFMHLVKSLNRNIKADNFKCVFMCTCLYFTL